MAQNTGNPSLLQSLGRLIFSKSGNYKTRYGKAYGSNSVDYRKHKSLLQNGDAPEKFKRLAEIVPGDKIVDVGAGEGILSLVIAASKAKARAIDVTPRRYETGLALKEKWLSLGKTAEGCEYVLGDALADPSLLDGFDTLVASRVIYYFGDNIDRFIAQAAERVEYICLVGNASRNRRYARGKVPADIGENVKYSTPEGMKSLLQKHGFEIIQTADFGDPIVIGRKTRS